MIYINSLFKKAIAATSAVALLGSLFTSTAFAAPSSGLSLTPWTFVGAAGDCGTGYPAGTPGNVTSKWDNTVGNPPPSLFLEKKALTTDCSSAGATVNGVAGMTNLTELDFDIKTGSLCTGGSPRFNVDASDGFHFVGGCGNGTQTDLGNGWTHVVFDLSNPTQAYPVLTPGATINSIDLILDEQGSAYVDNVSVNTTVIGSPTNNQAKELCKNGGWKTLTDGNGHSFKNQGDCVSYFATGGKNPGNG